MKRMLSLLSSLTLLTPLSIDLYSCNNSVKEDPKVSQQKVDELVELFNYYNEHNATAVLLFKKYPLFVNLDNAIDDFYQKYLHKKLDKIYKLNFQELLLNSVIFSAYSDDIEYWIKDENEKTENKEFIKKQLSKFNFLRLNLEKSKEYLEIFNKNPASYWIDVWNNPQVRVLTDSDDILKKIKNCNSDNCSFYNEINLKLQYIQKDGISITSTNSFKIAILNKLKSEV